MNINQINQNLIEKIKSRTSKSIIDSLAEILPLSKEAIYRRIRGEVLFSYSEAVLISQKLQISLDEINDNVNNYFTFRINSLSEKSPEETYIETLDLGIRGFTKDESSDNAYLFFTTPGIPVSILSNYKYLSKLRYYKYLYENRGLEIQKNKLAETIISDNLATLTNTFLHLMRQLNSTFMLSDRMFEHYVKELKHFTILELIDESELEFIKKDLHNLIDEFEMIVATGKYKDGANVWVYLADINIDSTFGVLEKGEAAFSFSKMFGMNYAVSKNLQVYKMYKNAFEDLKDYATLITQSGSAKRTAFFNRQHQIIDEIL